MWGHRANRRVKTTNAQACIAAMDIVILIDYTGSMGSAIEGVKSSIASLLATIETESNNDYRLALVLFDESTGGSSYSSSPSYLNLPSDQKVINGNVRITALNKFAQNNYADSIVRLQEINTSTFPLGDGQNIPEPSDYALKLVIENNLVGAFRSNVNKSVIIFTDAVNSGLNDIHEPSDQVELMRLAALARDLGITISVNNISGPPSVNTLFRPVTEVTNGAFAQGNNINIIKNLIINTCTVLDEILPVVATTNLTNITNSGFTVSGNVTSEGSNPVIERGFLYSTNSVNLLEGQATKITNGSGTGVFTSNISVNLNGVVLYVRAYAKNANNISYGDKLRVSTVPVTIPNVDISNLYIESNTLKLSGVIVSDGGGTLLERGFVYSNTNTTPTIGGANTTKVVVPGLFPQYSTDILLSQPATYYGRAYAINSAGTSYSLVKNNAPGHILKIKFSRYAEGTLEVTIGANPTLYYTTNVNLELNVPLNSNIIVSLTTPLPSATRNLYIVNNDNVVVDLSQEPNNIIGINFITNGVASITAGTI